MALTDRTLLSGNELHIWWAKLDDKRWPNAERLPAADRDRAEGMLLAEARSRWVGSRWALRSVLARYMERTPEEIRLCTGSHGKLMLTARAAPRFNLSHSGDLALIVVAQKHVVGVDVEQIRLRYNLRRLIRCALSPAEAQLIEAAPPQSRLAAFHSAWVRTEAIAKCFGTGLVGPTPKIAVAVRNFDAGPRFAAAVAVTGDAIPPLHHFAIGPTDVGVHRVPARQIGEDLPGQLWAYGSLP